MSLEILIVDDESDICRLISESLEDEGYYTRYALEGSLALEAIQMRLPNLVILDIWLGDSQFDGMKLLELLRKDYPDLPVVMMSGHGTIETAVKAIKMGAYDFIEKPFKTDRLLHVVKRAYDNEKLRRENLDLKSRTFEVTELTGNAPLTTQLRQLIDRVAPTNSRILISGGPGSGKEVAARLIHRKSKRQEGPFIVLNCATLEPEQFESVLFGSEEKEGQKIGLLEQAHRGTLLLDEVLDMPLTTQGKIVRLLQEQTFTRLGGKRKVEVDVRVIASTCRDIKEAILEKKFREDLYYRLNVVPIHIPYLKERREDVPLLVKELTKHLSTLNGLPFKIFSDEALHILQGYEWPGNVRQLKNVIEWILIMTPLSDHAKISLSALPSEIYGEVSSISHPAHNAQIMDLSLREARETFEKDYLQAQVLRFSGNISKTANKIGMERSALHRKMKNLGIDSNSR